MAKYVFLNLPTYGHVNPTLAVVQELVSRGQEVSYYLTEEFRDLRNTCTNIDSAPSWDEAQEGIKQYQTSIS